MRLQQARKGTGASTIAKGRLRGKLTIDLGPGRERNRRWSLPRGVGEAIEQGQAWRRLGRAKGLVDRKTEAGGLLEPAGG